MLITLENVMNKRGREHWAWGRWLLKHNEREMFNGYEERKRAVRERNNNFCSPSDAKCLNSFWIAWIPALEQTCWFLFVKGKQSGSGILSSYPFDSSNALEEEKHFTCRATKIEYACDVDAMIYPTFFWRMFQRPDPKSSNFKRSL